MTEHKHAEVLRAIADGKEVECRPKGYYGNADWFTTMNIINPINPITRPDYEWRVKPEPKPDVVDERRLYWNKAYRGAIDDAVFNHTPHFAPVADFRLTFDGETGKLKYAVVLE